MAVLNFRTDERSERALAELMADGSTTSDAIRQNDRAESRRVLAEMDTLRAW